jgi:ABC-2 type transport system permease protein
MTKLLAVIKREYVQRVRSRMFILSTVLGPIIMGLFSAAPALVFSIKTGGPTRIAIVDQTERLYGRIQQSLAEEGASEPIGEAGASEPSTPALNPGAPGGFGPITSSNTHGVQLEHAPLDGGLNEIEKALNSRIERDEIEGYVLLPADVLEGGHATYHTRNPSDFFTTKKLAEHLSKAAIEQRMVDANIAPELLRQKSTPLDIRVVRAGGPLDEESSGEFLFVFVAGFLIYITILMYGQVILGAVVEEKETRVAEVLFSSVNSFKLMLGKLLGVSLVALSQFAIWGLAAGAFLLYGIGRMAARGMPISVPHVRPVVMLYFVLFFLLGYFIYATIYALLGSVVTTAQEGGQLAVPVVLLLVVGFYLAFPVIRSPDSAFAVWVSMVPFFAPITMLVRIVTRTPPLWQILLSLSIGFSTVFLLLWLAGRVYRVGMLMYGKKATIPEVLRWIRQD